MKSKTKRILAFLCAVVLVATTFLGNWYTKQAKAAIDPKPIQLDGFENVTLSDFKDSNGNAMQPGEYRSDKNGETSWDPFYSLSGGSLDKKLVSMKIKYHGGNENQYSLMFGGKGTYSSFNLRPSGNGQTLYVDSTWAESIIDKSNYDVQYMEASKAGLSSFIGTEFILQMSFEYGEVVNDKTTLTIGMYINGQPYSGGKLTIPNCNVNALAGGLGVYVEYTNNQVAVITLDNVNFPDEPIQLDGFDNVTLSDFKDSNGNAMQPGEYRSDKNDGTSWDPFYSLSGGSLDKKLVSMKIKYHGGNEHQYSLMFGGTGTYSSFNLRPSGNGQTLYVDSTWAESIIDKSSYNPPYMEASKAGLDSFIGEEFLLQMSFEYGEVVDGKTTLTIGMYINSKLYNNEKFTIPNCNVSALSAGLGVYVEYTNNQVAVITLDNVNIPAKPIQLKGFENLTLSNFTDGSGKQMVPGIYKSGVSSTSTATYDPFYSVQGLNSLDKKLISVRINYGGGESQHSLVFGGTGTYSSFNLRPSGDGQKLFVDSSWAESIIDKSSYNPPYMEASKAGLDSFIGTEFLLQMSFEYGDVVDGKTTLTIGMYIDGELYNGEKFTIPNCNVSALSAGLGVYVEEVNETDSTISLDNVEFPVEVDPFEGYTKVSVEDFVDNSGNTMESKIYPYIPENTESFHLKEHENFDNKVLSMKVKFLRGAGDTRLEVGGVGAWSGLGVFVSSDGNYLFVADTYGKLNSATPNFPMEIHKDSVGVTSFINNPFLLQMSFKYVDSDSNGTADQILLGVYVEGNLYNEQLYTLNVKDINNFGNCINLDRENADSVIIVSSINNDTFPADPEKQPDPNFTKLTFAHFGIKDGTYSVDGAACDIEGAYSTKEQLDKTVISGNIEISGDGSNWLLLGGKGEDSWSGLRFDMSSKDTIHIKSYVTGSEVNYGSLSSSVAGVDFLGQNYKLMISSEIVNGNDVKLGIWFEGKLYNEEYITLQGYAQYWGNRFGVYCVDGVSVTVGSDMSLFEQPSENLQKVTFFHYGVDDGTYESVADINTKGTYKLGNTSAGTVLCGTVQLHDTDKNEIHIFLGAGANVWEGIRLTKYQGDANLKLLYGTNGAEIETFKSDVAGVDFTKDSFDLMWSIEWTDNDGGGESNDLKIGVWFDGFLYNQAYCYINNYTSTVENVFATYCGTGTSITLNSIYELTKLPDKSLDKITFSDFGIESGTFEKGVDLVATGEAKKYPKLDGTVFSGDFRFNKEGKYDIIYASDGGWDGLRLVLENGNINVAWYKGSESKSVASVTPAQAYVDAFIKNTFNLMISTELVDADGDGMTNDIKIGLWFDEILFANGDSDYFIVKDWGDYLDNGFGVCCETADTSFLVRNVAKYQANPYYYEDISSYRQDSGFTYPKVEGYVFAGWYEDAEYTIPIDPSVKSEDAKDAWAKFVDEEVLSVKPQIKLNVDGTVPDTTDIRFVTTVDSKMYRGVSFYIATKKDADYGSERDTADIEENSRMVYKQLYYVGQNAEVMTYKANVFSWMSQYFKTFTLEGIPETDYDVMIKVTPYWITADGTIVRGKILETCVDDYTPSTSTTTPAKVTNDFLGENTMPIAGYSGPYAHTDGSDSSLFPNFNTDEYFKMFADAGINLITHSFTSYDSNPDYTKKSLELGSKYGVAVYVDDNYIFDKSQTEIADRIKEYSSYDAFAGLHLVDEPGTSNFKSDSTNGLVTAYSDEATALNNLKQLYYANMFPIVDTDRWSSNILSSTNRSNYEAYINEFNNTLKPPYLSYDYYPFQENLKDSGEYQLDTYFYGLATMRNIAKTANDGSEKPFWGYVQAGSQWNDHRETKEYEKEYYPSESQFNWNVNTTLAFGAKGIQYFPLIQPEKFAYSSGEGANTVWSFEHNGLIGAWGNKTQWYYYAQEINKHIAAIDEVLMNSTSTQIIAPKDYANSDFSTKSGIFTTTYTPFAGVTASQSYKELTGVSGNAVIGCFDYRGQTALYVVNYETFDVGETESTQNITLTFSETHNIKMIRNAETTKQNGNTLSLTMNPGEGVLLVIE